MIPLLTEQDDFPNPYNATQYHEGLVCITRSLIPRQILLAYGKGIFPWHYDGQFFYWFSIVPRAVLLPENLKIARSLKKSIKNHRYIISINQDFMGVMAACANQTRPNQNGSWITSEFQTAYYQLHQMGYAHSFEFYNENNQLAGGLYGVQIGCVFFGESMFAYQSDASKIAFAHAVPFLAQCGIQLIDCQQDTEHLHRFGSHLMPLGDFQAALAYLTATPLQRPLIPQIIVEMN